MNEMAAPAQPDYIADAVAFRARVPIAPEEADGLRWQVIDTGAGNKTLCFLPGTLGNADIFRNQIEALAPGRRIISVSYPMVGDVARIADGLARLLDRRGIETASVLGSSLGGVIAQTFAARHPGRVAMLYIANSLADTDVIRATFPTEAVINGTPAGVLRKGILAQMAKWPEPTPEFAAIKRFLANELTTRIPGRSFKARALCLARLDAIPKAAVPEARIVVIQAEDDPLIPPPTREGVVRRYPGAQVHSFASGGHFPYLTRPADYSRLLVDTLD